MGRSLQRSNSVLCKHKMLGQPGKLLYQFCERESPYHRLPLTNKIDELASGSFAGLKSLRSCDIHPASWFAVAWYPIYHVPAGHNIRELGASFLTFHSLTLGPEHGVVLSQEIFSARPCSPVPNGPAAMILSERYRDTMRNSAHTDDCAVLHPFAFAPYRMQGRLWQELSPETSDSMLAAAGAWVDRRQFCHSDLEFFMRSSRPSQAPSGPRRHSHA
eukprot:scaffold82967_cov51-Prasinocladus_malaysianus.AAC.1